MSPEILIPVLMSVALLWWVSRGMAWRTMLAVTAVTLAIIAGVLMLTR